MKYICISRRVVLTILVVISALDTYSQKIDWKDHSDETFVYRISDKQAEKLLRSKTPDSLLGQMLTDPFAKYIRVWGDKPSQGHFVTAKVIRNKVLYNYSPTYPFQIFLFEEYGKLTIQVVDKDGKIRKDAKVKIKGNWFMQHKRVSYNARTKTYSIAEFSNKASRLLTVELDGFTAILDLRKNFVNNWNSGGIYAESKPDFYSYMITDKNKYKPGETVRFKSYALNGNRQPISGDLELWMVGQNYDFKKISTVKPYNPGGFASEFLLHDSLKIRLDNYYLIQLRQNDGRIVANANFSYEDYELYDNTLQVEMKSKVQYYPDVNSIEIKATDANGLILQDAKAHLTVTAMRISNPIKDLIVVPDTLLSRKIDLDNVEPTKVEIPSSIFGDADCGYNVSVEVITFDNQKMESSNYGQFFRSRNEIQMTTRNDTLRFEFRELGKIKEIEAEFSYPGLEKPKTVNLPYEIPFDQKISNYNLKVTEPKSEKIFPVNHLDHGFDIKGEMVGDSLLVEVLNPLKLQFSWYIYQGDMLLKKGSGRELSFKRAGLDMDLRHYVDIFYYIGDTERSFSREFTPRKTLLRVDANLPDRVYPGQKIDATVTVRDAKGRPVKGVDLTAMAANSLLDYYVPDMEDYGTPPSYRGSESSYETDERYYSYSAPLDYAKWRPMAALDTMDYYRFAYPRGSMFRHGVETPDSTTQFAVYVMKNGEAVNSYVIEDNGVPVYFLWTENLKGFSFATDHDTKHKISVRLHDRVLIFDSLKFEAGRKTILSVELGYLPGSVKSNSMDSRDRYKRHILRNDEAVNYSRYIATMPVDNKLKYTYLTQGDNVIPIYHYMLNAYKPQIMSGPVVPGKYRYNLGVEYKHTGGVGYEFDENVVYKNAMPTTPEYLQFSSSNDFRTLNQFNFSRKYLEYAVQEIEQNARRWFPRAIQIVQDNIKLHFRLPIEKDSTGISNLILRDRTQNTLYYPDSIEYGHRRYNNIVPGDYDVILLYNNGKYLRFDSLNIARNTYTDLNMAAGVHHQYDSLSAKWLPLNITPVNVRYNPANHYSSRPMYQMTYSRPLNRSANVVQGYVVDIDQGMPVIGATVKVSGTTNAVTTDINGFFQIGVEGACTLDIMFIGYATQRVDVLPDTEIRVVMYDNAMILEETVVVGYGTQKRTSLTGSVTRLSGAMGGVNIQNAPSVTDQENAKMELDVVKEGSVTFSPDLADAVRDSENIEPSPAENEGKAAEARLYQEIMMLGGLRSNFSDVGFWEPRLFTDKDGKANFSVTFPDNITMWNAVIYAMNRKLQTGTYRKSIKSYKPLMAELKTPQFLVVTDSSYFASNIRNYTDSKTIRGSVKFAIAQDTVMSKIVEFETSVQDKMLVVAGQTDSIKATYLFTRDDGYADGERREINVVPQGTEIAKGTLKFLSNGDKEDLRAESGEQVHVKIASKQLDVYLDAADYLRGYRYACNEQLASKLIGLINTKLYENFAGEKFKYDKDVNNIIKRLIQNQNGGKLWSWWGNSSDTSFWMSAHVLRALKMARDNGYPVSLNIRDIEQDYVDTKSYRNRSMYDIEILHALSEWGTQQDYAPAVSEFEAQIRKLEIREDSLAKAQRRPRYTSYLKEKLMLWEIRQRQGLDYKSDSVSKYFKKDVLGAIACDDGIQRYWYADNLQTTLIAYRIVKNDPVLAHNKEAMQMYVLGTKRYGWNTYQSASAVWTIMPDLLAQAASKDKPATVLLRGKDNKELTKFPYQTTLSAGEELKVEKKEGMPLIYTAYTIKRVTQANNGDAFEVKTKINTGDTLTAGKPVTLTATVKVKQKNAEHVMIEIPIPAGCSYESKPNYFYRFNEVHREYFKEKTVIFCKSLPEGTYEFTINLLPRYTGRYTLNPAKVEMMYFPTVNANNSIRRVEINERD